MRRRIDPLDYIGKRYGRLVVIGEAGKGKYGEKLFRCLCDCGKEANSNAYNLQHGRIVSCGCKSEERRRAIGEERRTHGCSNTRLYEKWLEMKERCKRDKYYKAAGITVCEDWLDFSVFMKWSVEHGYEDNLSLERKDNKKGYSPDNCEWIPFSEQAWNKLNTIFITYHGETKAMGRWAKETGIKYDTLRNRHQRGWTDEEIIEGRPRCRE